MALSDTEVLCNLALGCVGEYQIEEGKTSTKQYELCSRYYVSARDEVLCEHPWNEAKKRTILVQDATAPLFGYSYRFALPSDCLKVLTLGDGENDWYRWEVENGYILTDYTQSPIGWAADIDFVAGQYCTLSDITYLCNVTHTSATATSPDTDTTTWTTAGGDYQILYLEYIYQLSDIDLFSPKLKDAIVIRLASKVAPGITKDPKIKIDLLNEFETLSMPKARSVDAQQGKPKPLFKSQWWRSRY